jgi:hypothetical protein
MAQEMGGARVTFRNVELEFAQQIPAFSLRIF